MSSKTNTEISSLNQAAFHKMLIVHSFDLRGYDLKAFQLLPRSNCTWQMAKKLLLASEHNKLHSYFLTYAVHWEHWNVPLLVQKKKLHTLIFCWTAVCFDNGVHLLWHCFNNLMQFISIQSCIHFWPRFCWQESRTIPSVFSSTSQKLLMGQSQDSANLMSENYSSCYWHSFVLMLHSFTNRAPMNLGIVVLEYARAIREEKNPSMG